PRRVPTKIRAGEASIATRTRRPVKKGGGGRSNNPTLRADPILYTEKGISSNETHTEYESPIALHRLPSLQDGGGEGDEGPVEKERLALPRRLKRRLPPCEAPQDGSKVRSVQTPRGVVPMEGASLWVQGRTEIFPEADGRCTRDSKAQRWTSVCSIPRRHPDY